MARLAAGAELRQGFTVDEVRAHGGVAFGILGHARGGAPVREEARVVSRRGQPPFNRGQGGGSSKPTTRTRRMTSGYYSIGGRTDGGAEVHLTTRAACWPFPTNDGRVCIAAGSRA